MPQVVESLAWQSRCPERALEPPGHADPVERRAEGRREHEVREGVGRRKPAGEGLPWTRPIASQSFRSTRYVRVRTTSAGRPPSSARAARMMAKHRRAWVAGSGSHDPSGQTGAVPLTTTRCPTRTARLNPIRDSNGDPDDTRRRSMAASLAGSRPCIGD
jgi:hypothetical protein